MAIVSMAFIRNAVCKLSVGSSSSKTCKAQPGWDVADTSPPCLLLKAQQHTQSCLGQLGVCAWFVSTSPCPSLTGGWRSRGLAPSPTRHASPHLDVLCQLHFAAEGIHVLQQGTVSAHGADALQELHFLFLILAATKRTTGSVRGENQSPQHRSAATCGAV